MEQIVYVAIGIGSCIVVLIVLWILCKCRRRSRFDYTAIDEEKSLIYKWETEKLTQKNTQRDAVLLNCYYYLKDTKTYSVVNHLPEIGSRLNKHWFLVKNSKTRMDAVLAMLEWSPKSLIPCSKQTRNTLKELLDALEHPYLLPILSIDVMLDREMVIIIQPYSPAGSLKDIIYGSRPTSPWLEKYEFKGKGLTVLQIKNYGRQILEALIYLQERGLPSCSHVHSGNVYLIDGACSALGLSFFGHRAGALWFRLPCLPASKLCNHASLTLLPSLEKNTNFQTSKEWIKESTILPETAVELRLQQTGYHTAEDRLHDETV